jgi:hypothetical protein
MAVTWRRYDLRGRAAPPRRRAMPRHRGLCAPTKVRRARHTNGVTSHRLRVLAPEKLRQWQETRLERERLPVRRREAGEDTCGCVFRRCAAGGVGRRPGHRCAAACSGERKDAGGVRRLEAACSGGSIPADRGGAARACVWRERGERLRFGDGAWKKKP